MSLSLGKNNIENKQFKHFHQADLIQNSSQKCFNSLHAGNFAGFSDVCCLFFRKTNVSNRKYLQDAKQFGSRSYMTNAMIGDEFTGPWQDNSLQIKINFLISQPKHMLWVPRKEEHD